MHCTKPMGRRLIERDLDRRVAETHVGIAAPYRFTALGMPATNAMGSVRPGKRKPRPTGDPRKRVPYLQRYTYNLRETSNWSNCCERR
jgi:hypothetical protein